MLYESELEKAPILCFSCASIYERPAQKLTIIICPECGFSTTYERYREFYRHAFYAVRYGIQYREFYEHQDKKSSLKPFLTSLGELSTFIGLAIASGVLGNAAYDGVKIAVKRILSQREKCKGHERVNFTDTEIEKLISYLVDYEDGFSKLPEKIRHEIAEEILGDSAAENPAIANKLTKLLFESNNPSQANKRQAVILYRELGRRSAVRARKSPNRPAWSFWGRTGN